MSQTLNRVRSPSTPGTRSINNNNNIMAGGPAEKKVLGMLWKQAGAGMAMGFTAAIGYYYTVSKPDMDKIAQYYTKQDQSKQ